MVCVCLVVLLFVWFGVCLVVAFDCVWFTSFVLTLGIYCVNSVVLQSFYLGVDIDLFVFLMIL